MYINAKPYRSPNKTSIFKQVPKHPVIVAEKPNSLLTQCYSFSSNMNLVISGLPSATIFSFYVMECYPLLMVYKIYKANKNAEWGFAVKIVPFQGRAQPAPSNTLQHLRCVFMPRTATANSIWMAREGSKDRKSFQY